jgi:hypothetical protein
MNRLSRSVLLLLGASCVAYAALFAANLHFLKVAVAHSRLFWSGLAGAMFFFVAAIRFSPRARLNVVAVVLCFATVEAMLQVCGWLGWLPGVNTKLRVPYGRVYWTGEGFSNSIRNRYGWFFSSFDLKSPRRLAVIGDSFVEAVEVDWTKNHAALLGRLIKAQDPGTTVIGLGNHGTSPAQHIETLQYAQKHFRPQEVVLFLYLGNDIVESSPALNYLLPEEMIYYTLDEQNQLLLNPRSADYRERFVKILENCHRPLLLHLPFMLNSHCMTLQSLVSIRDALGKRQRGGLLAKRGYTKTGLNLAPFAAEQNADTKQALAVMLAELNRCMEICDSNGMFLRLVTIPFFPQEFYETQRGADWTLKIGGYDYLLPDREIAAFAKSHDKPFLSIADHLAAKRVNAEDIRALYLSNGSGHFTEAGHRLCAQAVFDTFYATNQP